MTRFLFADHAELGALIAAVDPAVRFTAPKLASSRLGALLAPFKSEEDARAAIEGVGGVMREE